MVWCLWWFALILTFESHYERSQTQSEKTTFEGKAGVVPSQTWGVLFESKAAIDPLSPSTRTSFSRSSFPSTYPSRNGAASRGAAELVLWNVQENEITQRSVLRPMWPTLARLYLLPSQVQVPEELRGLLRWLRGGLQHDPMDWKYMDGAQTPEPEARPERAIGQEDKAEAAEERQRKGPGQGRRERGLCTAGCSAPTSASFDGTLCSPSSMDDYANASCGSASGASSRTEAQRSHEPPQEEKRRSRHPRDCQQIRLLWQEVFQEADAQCCERPRRGQECYGRCDPGQSQPDAQLADFPHSVSGPLEGVHQPVSATGTEMPGGNLSSKGGSQQGEDRISGTHAGGSRGDLRRGCRPQGTDRSCLQNSGRNGEHAQQPPSACRTGGKRQSGSGGEISQAASQIQPWKRRRCSHGRCGLRGLRGLQAASLAVFSTARSVMAFGCIGHRACEPVEATIMQWNHSAVREGWFIPPWEASERALALHLEVQPDLLHIPPVPIWQGLGLPMPKRRSGQNRQVHFAPTASGWFEDPCANIWNRHDLLHRDELDPGDRIGAQLSDSKKPAVLEPTSRSQATRAYVEIDIEIDQPTWSVDDAVPTKQSRINDAWHHVPSRMNFAGDNADEPGPGDGQFFLHEAPEYIQTMFDVFLHEGLLEGPRLSESIHFRSWYLHHRHQRQWTRPRVLELNGHWRFWANDMISGWRDQVIEEDDIGIYICHPNPPRSGMEHEIFADLIIAQGLDLPSWAGLVTLIRAGDRAAREDFTVASSLPQFVSGYALATAVQHVQQCHLHGCRIRHARNLIPFNHEPVHEMINGHTFTVTPQSSQAMPAAHPVPTGNIEGEAVPPSLEHDEEDPQDMHDDHDDPASSAMSSDSPQGQTQAAHIYRLGHPPSFGHLDWRSYLTALRDAAQLIRVHKLDFRDTMKVKKPSLYNISRTLHKGLRRNSS